MGDPDLPMDREVIRTNRRYLHSVARWIAPADYRASRDRYGCPPRLLALLDRPIDEQPTYTDLLVHAAQRLPVPVRYLELGVSVGKNLYVLARALRDAILIGFDWERINPVLERQFVRTGTEGRLRWYRCAGNRVGYLQGDIASAADWAALAGWRFNLILSDACHQPTMLRNELAMLARYDLLDPAGFVIVWDDLDRRASGPVTRAYREIAGALRSRYGLGAGAAFRVALNGWLGQHEHRHTVGVVNSIGLDASSFT